MSNFPWRLFLQGCKLIIVLIFFEVERAAHAWFDAKPSLNIPKTFPKHSNILATILRTFWSVVPVRRMFENDDEKSGAPL